VIKNSSVQYYLWVNVYFKNESLRRRKKNIFALQTIFADILFLWTTLNAKAFPFCLQIVFTKLLLLLSKLSCVKFIVKYTLMKVTWICIHNLRLVFWQVFVAYRAYLNSYSINFSNTGVTFWMDQVANPGKLFLCSRRILSIFAVKLHHFIINQVLDF